MKKKSTTKGIKIAVGVPIPQMISPDFTRNVVGIMTTTLTKLPNLESLVYIDKGGVRTDKNRNVIIQKALEADMDYILWLDADMIYPHDIVLKYMENKFDVIGCVYFKRSAPFDPVAYVNGTNPIRPYNIVDPRKLPKDSVVEVDGLGFGGVMVNTKVYKAMGDDKWMKYGDNFHLPFECEGQLTHDLDWCKKAKNHGFKIYLHTGVTAGHIADHIVTQEDWELGMAKEREKLPKINVIMPTIHPEIAKKTAKILTSRAGMPHKMIVVEDENKTGFVATCNAVVRENPADYYVYLTDDIFPSRNWLLDSYNLAVEKNAGLVGYDDGKWGGSIATCGLVEHKWMVKNYDGNMFFPGYFGHYNDTELTILALNDKKYAYNPTISLIEVDYEKETKKVHEADKALFKQRKGLGFGGKVTDKDLIENYA